MKPDFATHDRQQLIRSMRPWWVRVREFLTERSEP